MINENNSSQNSGGSEFKNPQAAPSVLWLSLK
jgi:hypothetical protein